LKVDTPYSPGHTLVTANARIAIQSLTAAEAKSNSDTGGETRKFNAVAPLTAFLRGSNLLMHKGFGL
jgi:hypothetical protein